MLRRRSIILGLISLLLILLGGSWFVLGTKDTTPPAVQSAKTNSPSPKISSSNNPHATLEIFSGDVFIEEDTAQKKVLAHDKQLVSKGARISTGPQGRAQIIYNGKSVTRIDHNSEFVLQNVQDTPTAIHVTLQKGRIWSRVQKLFGKESYTSQSPTVIATVRGTSFGHGILPDGRNRVISSRRTVDVQCQNYTQKGSVTTLKVFILNCEEGTPSDIIAIRDLDKDEWYIFNVEQDRILDERFGKDIYDDEETLSPTVTKKPTVAPSPTRQIPTPTNTPKPNQPTTPPSATPTVTPTPTPTPMRQQTPPSPTPTPTTPFLLRAPILNQPVTFITPTPTFVQIR